MINNLLLLSQFEINMSTLLTWSLYNKSQTYNIKVEIWKSIMKSDMFIDMVGIHSVLTLVTVAHLTKSLKTVKKKGYLTCFKLYIRVFFNGYSLAQRICIYRQWLNGWRTFSKHGKNKIQYPRGFNSLWHFIHTYTHVYTIWAHPHKYRRIGLTAWVFHHCQRQE